MLRVMSSPIAVILGALVGLALLGVAGTQLSPPGPATPLSILAENYSISVPAFLNSSNLTPTPCPVVGVQCGAVGVAQFEFNLSNSSRISGFLSASRPLQLIFASGVEIENVQCGFVVPACHGDTRAGPGYAHYLPGPAEEEQSNAYNLTNVSWNFNGSGNLLPAGHWVVYLLNWNYSSAIMTVSQTVAAG